MTHHLTERFAVHAQDFRHYETAQLREHFLIANLFIADTVQLTYTHYDRLIVGGVFPVNGPISLQAPDILRAEYFLQRRELGIINIGGAGSVQAGDELYELNNCDALYLGRGVKSVRFTSVDANRPAKFYLNSAPAHTIFANCKVGQDTLKPLEIGSAATANHRVIHKLLVCPTIQTCQLQMGLTQLQTGSVWNTMPPHTHSRRMEAYFYFALQPQQAVCHFLGEARETRHIWVNNEEAVLSPPWSIHSGVGTGSYAFIWGMAGENLEYDDMDFHPPTTLR